MSPITTVTTPSQTIPVRTDLASAASGGMLRLWDANTGRPIGDPLAGHTGTVAAVALPDRSRYSPGGDASGRVRLWDPATGRPLVDWQGSDEHPVTAMAAAPRPAGLLTVGSADGTVRLCDVRRAVPHR